MTEADKVQEKCDHGIVFDVKVCYQEELPSEAVRKKYPRLDGKCPKGCGFYGIAYRSYEHFMAGNWGRLQ